jgi:hypothetical protein
MFGLFCARPKLENLFNVALFSEKSHQKVINHVFEFEQENPRIALKCYHKTNKNSKHGVKKSSKSHQKVITSKRS